MDVIPDPIYTGSLHNLVHECGNNIEVDMYYYISVYDYNYDDTNNDCEYVGYVLYKNEYDVSITIYKRRYIINGNEQEWDDANPQNMTLYWSDIDTSRVRPCIRFYRTLHQR